VATTADEELRPVTEEDLVMQPFLGVPVTVPEDDADGRTEPSGPDDTSGFDQRHREAFTGLLYVGKLSTRVTHFGHSFDLETPSQREKLEAGILHKRYVNTISGDIAWATLTVALYLTAVDDEPLPEPLGPDTQTQVKERFNWVLDNLKPGVVETLFTDCLELDAQVNDVLGELERLSKVSG
jgi:hypothetical protein